MFARFLVPVDHLCALVTVSRLEMACHCGLLAI
jgi:hypothetical protein